jgi:O-antigen/teichoic acid export membrane protein
VLGVARAEPIRLPVRELLAFSLPLLAIDLALVARSALDAVFVEYFHGTTEVAALRSVQPIARLNQLVFMSFALLYTPTASRLFARGDDAGLDDLYWHSAVWQALVSFPIFAATFALADAATVTLFGSDYADAAPILALLSVGYYINAATGQNSLTLRVFGRVRTIVIGALLTAAGTVALDLLLIPPLGALGAAIAAAAALIGQNIYYQVALHRTTPVAGFHVRYAAVYGAISIGAAAILFMQLLLHPPLVLSAATVAILTFCLIGIFRGELRLGATFPELRRLPGLGRLVG